MNGRWREAKTVSIEDKGKEDGKCYLYMYHEVPLRYML